MYSTDCSSYSFEQFVVNLPSPQSCEQSANETRLVEVVTPLDEDEQPQANSLPEGCVIIQPRRELLITRPSPSCAV